MLRRRKSKLKGIWMSPGTSLPYAVLYLATLFGISHKIYRTSQRIWTIIIASRFKVLEAGREFDFSWYFVLKEVIFPFKWYFVLKEMPDSACVALVLIFAHTFSLEFWTQPWCHGQLENSWILSPCVQLGYSYCVQEERSKVLACASTHIQYPST